MVWDGVEKRRFVRVKLPCKVIVHMPKEYSIESFTENISAGGIRVLLKEKLEVSSIIGLEINLGEELVVCKGRIVWMVEKESGSSSVVKLNDTGIEFFEMKEEERKKVERKIKSIKA